MPKRDEIFSKRVQERMAELGLSRPDLAERLGCTRQSVSVMLVGSPRLDTLRRLAKALECEVEELVR